MMFTVTFQEKERGMYQSRKEAPVLIFQKPNTKRLEGQNINKCQNTNNRGSVRVV